MSLRCAIYARYSSDQQNPVSIADQVRVCREYAASLCWNVSNDAVYTDEAISGASADRPALARLLDQALDSSRPFDVVLIDDTSRLSRRLVDAVSIFERLNFAGIRIVAVSQNIDSSNEQADVLVTVHGLVDSLYIKELGRKTHRGLDGQVLRGFHAGGRCFGYRIEREAGGARLVIEEREAELVRRIFEMSADGMSLKAIATTLNREQIPTSRPRAGKQFASWAPSAIRAILYNELYAGRMIWNRSHFIKHPGTNKRQRRPRPRSEWRIIEHSDLRIIDEGLWNRVRLRLEEKKKLFGNGGHLYRRSTSSPYLLTGLIKCGDCGANLQITGRDRRGQLYGCPQHSGRGTCENKLRISRKALERSLLSGIQRAILSPEILDYIVDRLIRELKASFDRGRSDRIEREARRKAIEEEIARLTAAIASAGHSKALLAALADRERELAALAPVSLGPKPFNMQEIREFVTSRLSDLQQFLNSRDVGRARTILARHVSSIRLVPTPDAGGRMRYVAEGEWNLLAGFMHCGGWI
ncbi:MAG TPA: recombinase family protein [Bryobacteraceae bacterium]|nr:recombinase family protein [Bryobacteraceae bacterium]